MSELLSQQVNVIYWLLREALTLDQGGYHYEALNTLRYLPRIMYNDGEDDPRRTCVFDALRAIREGEDDAVRTTEPTAREIQLHDYRQLAAANVFDDCLDKIQGYMQKAGYFKAMNSSWTLKDTRLTK